MSIAAKRNKKRLEKSEKIAEEVEGFTEDALENGIEEAINNKAEEMVDKAIERAGKKVLGAKHPSLYFLVDFIKAQRGYGPKVYDEDAVAELMESRRELGVESKYPDIEEVEELLNNNSDFLEDVIDEEMQEVEEIIEQLEGRESEEIADDLGEEIPESDEVETDSYEEDIKGKEDEEESEPKKCYSISLGFGDFKVSFNTCDRKKEENPDKPNRDWDGNYEEPELPEDDPDGTGWWCPIRRRSSHWTWVAEPGRPASFESVDRDSQSYIVGYWNVSAYPFGIWPGFKGEIYGKTTGLYETTVFDPATMNPGQQWETIRVPWELNQDFYSTGPFPPFVGGEFTPSYGWEYNSSISDYDARYLEATGEFIDYETPLISGTRINPDCYFVRPGDTPSPRKNDNKKPPTTYEEKKDKMNEQCCKATLSLLRKMSHVTGTAEEPIYPVPPPPGLPENSEIEEISNLTEQTRVLAELAQSPADSELLQKIANVTGTAEEPIYPVPPPPGLPENSEIEEISNLTEQTRVLAELAQSPADSELLQKIANVTGTAEEPIYPVPPPPGLPENSEIEEISNLTEQTRVLAELAQSPADSELLQRIANVTGTAETPQYPGELPDRLTDPNSPIKQIHNLAQWHLYNFDMMDELIGQFPIDLEIEGDNANPDNIAEALAEIYGMAIELKADTYENKMAIARTLTEVGLTRLIVNRIFKNIEAAIEYIDFEREEVEENIELTFNPLAYEDKDGDGDIDDDSLEEFLQPSKQPIKYWKSPDGSKDSLRKAISLLQEAAQITKALHWHRIPREPVAAANSLRSLINLGADVAQDFAQARGETGQSWQDFIKNVEENWRDKTGTITDDKSDNPRIKEIQ